MTATHSRLTLDLYQPPIHDVEGIYRVQGDETAMPDRMRRLSLLACDSFMVDLAPHVVISDMFRTPEASLDAMQRKAGVQPPSYSRHNYGEAIDLGVSETLHRMRGTGARLLPLPEYLAVGARPDELDGSPVQTKRQLDLWMAARGWFCYRGDHLSKIETWHFDHLGRPVLVTGVDGKVSLHAPLAYPYTSSRERSIAWGQVVAEHAHAWLSVTAAEFQALLADRGFYHGAIDGSIGPQARAAIGALQRAWKLDETSRIDARTTQVLAYVTGLIRVAPWAGAPSSLLPLA